MNANKKFLIAHLQQHDLNHRYENPVVINCNPLTGQKIGKQGALSVVFQATDNTNSEKVAIKFFDPDIRGTGLPYRLDLFERENDLLTNHQEEFEHFVSCNLSPICRYSYRYLEAKT